ETADLRPILGLNQLNHYLKKIQFHMVTLASIIPFLDSRDWHATLHLRDAYFHVLIYQGHRNVLGFVVNHLQYQFTVLLINLSAAPWVFTKCNAIVAAFLGRLRGEGLPLSGQLASQGPGQGSRGVQRSSYPVDVHGSRLLINADKSTTCLVQWIEFTGVVLYPSQSIPPGGVIPINPFP
ncbi:hypothetical protein KIL84_021548, partial [Mauremys mutica]